MTRYLISFDEDAMDHIPEEEMPAVADAAHAVISEAQAAGVWIFAGGMDEGVDPVTVAGDGHRHRRRPPVRGHHDPRRAVSRRGVELGREDRHRLPLCAGRERVRARPGCGELRANASCIDDESVVR